MGESFSTIIENLPSIIRVELNYIQTTKTQNYLYAIRNRMASIKSVHHN